MFFAVIFVCSFFLERPTSPDMLQQSRGTNAVKTYGKRRSLSPKAKRRISSSSESNISETLSDRVISMPPAQYNKSSTTRQCEKCVYKIKKLKKNVKSLHCKNYRLKKKVLTFSEKAVINNLLVAKPVAVKVFFNMQLYHKKRSRWSSAEKQLALSLHYKSPSLYKFLLYRLKFILPSIRTIQSWLRVNNLPTGLNTDLLKKLRAKVATMNTQEKLCAILIDEINLKKN